LEKTGPRVRGTSEISGKKIWVGEGGSSWCLRCVEGEADLAETSPCVVEQGSERCCLLWMWRSTHEILGQRGGILWGGGGGGLGGVFLVGGGGGGGFQPSSADGGRTDQISGSEKKTPAVEGQQFT